MKMPLRLGVERFARSGSTARDDSQKRSLIGEGDPPEMEIEKEEENKKEKHTEKAMAQALLHPAEMPMSPFPPQPPQAAMQQVKEVKKERGLLRLGGGERGELGQLEGLRLRGQRSNKTFIWPQVVMPECA